MGGSVVAQESRLGGLRIEVELPAAAALPSDTGEPARSGIATP